MSDRAKQMIPEVSQVYCKIFGVLGVVSLKWGKMFAAVGAVDVSAAMTAVEWLLKIAVLAATLGWTLAKWKNEKRNKREKP